MPSVTVPPGVEGIVALTELPEPGWSERWDRIIVDPAIKERLLNYLVFSLRHRGRVGPVGLPLHGLAIVAGPPGTGKTTLAGGVADRAARELGEPVLFVDIDPHSFPSQLLGESQRSVARLFERTLPDLAARAMPMVVLLDEVESLAVSRAGASLETNPVDVHRATEAVLAGVDFVARTCPQVTFFATTNHPTGVDVAFMSRADLVEQVGYPGAEAVHAILVDTLRELSDRRIDGDGLRRLADRCAEARTDARQVRKLVLRAICDRRELAIDPSSIEVADLEAAFDRQRERLEPAI
jgi:AAA+ superfamily predicted ATPase